VVLYNIKCYTFIQLYLQQVTLYVFPQVSSISASVKSHLWTNPNVFQSVWECISPYNTRNQRQWFWRWFLVFLMGVYQSSCVSSSMCVKVSSLDDNQEQQARHEWFSDLQQHIQKNEQYDIIYTDTRTGDFLWRKKKTCITPVWWQTVEEHIVHQ
jgi:hypothetical protein